YVRVLHHVDEEVLDGVPFVWDRPILRRVQRLEDLALVGNDRPKGRPDVDVRRVLRAGDVIEGEDEVDDIFVARREVPGHEPGLHGDSERMSSTAGQVRRITFPRQPPAVTL